MASKTDAQQAIWDGIVDICKDAEDYSGASKASMIRDAALAYRFAAGGAQPGNAVVEK